MKLNFRGRDEHVEAPASEQPIFPRFANLPMAPDPRSRRISEAAASAAQYVIDLETELDRLKDEVGFERNHGRLADEANKLLRRQCGDLQIENTHLRDTLSRVRTKLQVSGQIVLDAVAEANSWGGGEPEPAPAAEEEQAEQGSAP